MVVSCCAYSSTSKMGATFSSEKSADFRRTTWRYVPTKKNSSMDSWQQQCTHCMTGRHAPSFCTLEPAQDFFRPCYTPCSTEMYHKCAVKKKMKPTEILRMLHVQYREEVL
jgi:hypothetical protein